MRVLLTLVAIAAAARADGPPADGNWVLSTVTPTGESAVLILKIETKDKVPAASVVFVPKRGQAEPPKLELRDLKLSGPQISFNVRQVNTDALFTGTVGKDEKLVLGSFGIDPRAQRAKLTATTKDTLTAAEAFVRTPVEAYTKALTAQSKPLQLQFQARQEKDEDKKKELLAKIPAARKEAEEEYPKLMREVVSGHADAPAAYDAALALLRVGTRAKVTADEATKLVALLETQAAKYGPRFARSALVLSADLLAADKTLSSVAIVVAEKATKTLTDADPAAFQVDVLTSYRTVLENAGKTAELKTIEARLVKLETKLDTEYLATVPPFKPAPATRKAKDANKVAVLELFTGAQCPPCVAADVAFDALGKAYKPTDLILIQYHMHIPGPDPLTNPAAIARWDYYREKFSGDVRGTPTTVFNGKVQAGGGGGMANSEGKYKQYAGIIDPILEETTPVAVTGTAARGGDKIDVAIDVKGAGEKDEFKVRFLLVEENIKYVGGNKLRFHHQVVRAAPGGAAGFAVKAGASKHAATVDVGEIKKGLTKYLDGYAADERPFPNPNRPLDLAHLKVIALVQNDATGEIVQAAQFDVAEKTGSNR